MKNNEMNGEEENMKMIMINDNNNGDINDNNIIIMKSNEVILMKMMKWNINE